MNKIEMRVLKTDVIVTTPEGMEAIVTVKQLQWREAVPIFDGLLPPVQQWTDWQTAPEVYEEEVYEDRETEPELLKAGL